MRLIFLLEEPSARSFLEEWMPRQFPAIEFLCVEHQGKADLEKSLPRKLRGWRNPGDRFLILRDNDNGDCGKIKEHLLQICIQAGKPAAVIRLACQELESWYLGDLASVERAYEKPGIAGLQNRVKYRNPDHLGNPSEEMFNLISEFGKIDGARRLGKEMTLDSSKSHSFGVFVSGIQRLIEQS